MSKETSISPTILVDGSSYLFRAYHALPKLENKEGHPTGAIRGVVGMLRKLIQAYPDSKVVVVFDAKGKNFRHELYSEYKANRPPTPEDLVPQIKPIHQIVQAMGLPLLVIEGVEADDVIGTLAYEATEKGLNTIISTGDKDMAQLVSDHVTLINTMSDTAMDRQGVIEKFGVPPELIIDYLALMGDTVDNIPGIPKCGPKTASKWLNEIGPLDTIMSQADKVKGKIGENLRASLEQLPLSKELATIKCDVELEHSLEEISHSTPDQDLLLNLFEKFEFKTWIKEIKSGSSSTFSDNAVSDSPPASEDIPKEYETLFSEEEVKRWIEKIKSAKYFAFDTETTSLNYMDAELVGLSIAIEPGKAAYIPVAHDYMDAPEQLSREWILETFKPILTDPNIKKVGQNLKYDAHILANYDIDLKGIEDDTMLESYVLNSVSTRHDMDSLANKYLGLNTVKFEDIAGKGAKQLTFNQIHLDQASPYAAEDADITLRLHHALSSKLDEIESLGKVYRDIELPVVSVLNRMERNGARIDSQQLKIHSQELAERLQSLEKEAHDIAGEAFNLASPKQIGTILFERLNLPVIKKTPKGAPSTAEEVLQELAQDYPLPKLLMEYRELAKLKSTYTDKLPEMINPRTGRVHTSYHQAVAATGRLSSSDPNLQNIPVRNEQGRRIRQAFVAESGYKLISADYSQIELRIMAHLSGDTGLLKAFEQGADVHSATAAEVFSVDLDQVTSDQRRQAKAINFGLIYGMSAFGLARQIKVERNIAQGYIDRYFERYPGVQSYMERIKQEAYDNEYVETLLGRRLYLPNIKSTNRMHRNAAERTAINAPMQGTAADIIKLAMIKVDTWLEDKKIPAKMIMQVHDELILESTENQATEIAEELKSIMSEAMKLDVPLVVDAGIGNNWDEAH